MFTDVLKKLLKEKNISQKELAEKINISSSAISEWKKGKQPTIDKLIAISQVLDVSTSYLLFGEDENGLTLDENNLVKAYRKADERDKQTVNMILNRYNEIENKKGKSLA